MDNIFRFLKNNIVAIGLGLMFYSIYLYFAFSGNRICDCETTEKYSTNQTRTHRSVNRFYHK